MTAVALEKVERELSRLWEEEAKKSQTSRVELMTLVALVSEPRLAPRAAEVLAKVVTIHPSRTITAIWQEGDPPSIAADVMLHRNVARGSEACGDAIVLHTRGEGRDWLPENVDRLLLPELPAVVWWVGDLPDADDLFDRMVRRADVVLVNSAEMDLRDLEKLAMIAQASRGTYALLDLTWIRLRSLQDLVARFFDEPSARPYLDGLRKVEIVYTPRPGEQDAASTRVGLFLGWMGTALGWRPETARWQREGRASEMTIERSAAGAPIAVRVEAEDREGVHHGGIVTIRLHCEGPGAARGTFELARQANDPGFTRWSIEAPGVALPPQTLRIGQHEEWKLLARQLERPVRDPLFEASIHCAYRMVRSVAPRLSSPPPPPPRRS